MAQLISFNICGITFHIMAPESSRLRHIDPVYKEFTRQKNNPVNDIKINLDFSMPLLTDNSKLIFDNKINWTMYQEDGEYSIYWKRNEDQEPTWVAKFKPDLQDVTVHCGKRLLRKKDNVILITNPFQFPLDQLLVMFALNNLGGTLVHAAGMGLDRKGVLFTGVSGAGKTTTTRLFMEHKDVEVLSDDRIIIRKENDTHMIYGTPWPGDARIARNKSIPLKHIFFLNQAPQNRITKLSPGEAVKKILPVTSIQWYEKSMMTRSLRFLEKLVKAVPAYQLDFTPDQDAVKLVRKSLDSLQNTGSSGMMDSDHRGKSGR